MLATTWSDDIAWVAIVLTAFAACVTVVYARQTATKSRALRREAELPKSSHLAELDVGTIGTSALRHEVELALDDLHRARRAS